MESALLELAYEGGPDDEVSVIVRLREGSAVPPALRVISRFGLIVTARIRRSDIERVRELVASMKRPQDYSPAWDEDWTDDEASDLDVRPSDIRRSPNLPTGRGVIVCHLDWGLDFRHPAFRTADGKTRLLALWDQGGTYDARHPNRFGFGRIYSRAEIDAALTSRDPYAALGYRWWTSDRGNGSHGSHTFGISAGREVTGLPAGLACDADLIFVDLTTPTVRGPQALGSSTDLLEGCDFASEIAGVRPLVINASLGRQAGQHDGLTLTEQALDHLVNRRDCLAVTMSAGNYYAKAAHAQLTILPGESRSLNLALAEGRSKAELDVWYPRADWLTIEVKGPSGLAVGPLKPDEQGTLMLGGRAVGRVYNRSNDPNNGDNQASLFLFETAPAGNWQVLLEGESVGDGRVHAWVERNPAGASRLTFTETQVEPRSTVGTICNGFSTIAVAAYDAHSRQREPGRFSSAGPTRDGRLSRPTLAAPGVKVLSARSRSRDQSETPLQSRMSGTSMAAPHVAGCVALLFEAAPRPLSIDEVRALLADTVDSVPEAQRYRLGAGYLDVSAAVAAARAMPARASSARRRSSTSLLPRPHLRSPSAKETEMADQDYEDLSEDQPFDCDADDEQELEIDGDGLDTEDPDSLAATMEGEDIVEVADDEAEFDESWGGRRWRGGRPGLPFQIQVPIGGAGGLGLGIPIGGRSSPFALSLPLTGQAPPATAAPQPAGPPPAPMTTPAPTSPEPMLPQPEPALTTALDLPDPIAAATSYAAEAGELDTEACEACGPECRCDAAEDEAALAEALAIEQLESSYANRDFTDVDARYAGEQVVAAANGAIESYPDSSAALTDSITETLAGPEGLAESVVGDLLSPLQLFRDIISGRAAAPRMFGRNVRVLATPGQALTGVEPMRGDVVLRVLPAQRWALVSFVADSTLVPFSRLREAGLRPEGSQYALPGNYLQVIEGWPVPHSMEDRFARRITNAAELLPLDTMLLRLLPRGVGPEGVASEDDGPDAQTLKQGARGPAVTELQRRLNQLHARRSAARLPGLPNMPLAEDGVFGPRLRAVVEAMQRLAPAGIVPTPTGAMDRASWSALALLEAAAGMVSSSPLRQGPTTPGPVPTGAIAAGQETIERVALLSSHRGTPPDLIIRWNAMASVPERVDVVVHLHGFSGLGGSMRIDRHKLAISGLDFSNPSDPSQAGRTVPTLAVLPRGNYYGGATHAGYDFPALFAPGAFATLIRLALEKFGAAIGGQRVAAGKLIVTAHSGGGAALMRLLRDDTDPDEIYTFDALYNRPDALIQWAERKLRGSSTHPPALRVLFREGEGTASNSHAVALAISRAASGDPALASRFKVEATRETHNNIPRRYGWQLLADASADLDLGTGSRVPRRSSPDMEILPDRFEEEVELWEDDPAGGLSQAEVDRLAQREFANSAELESYFTANGNFADWFNRELGGRPPFVRPGGGGALRIPTGDAARARFHGFWDRLSLAYGQPRISLLEFASLLAIVMNETDGDFRGLIESSGRGGGGRTDSRGHHPGLAYFFDRIELRPGQFKASYNHLSSGRTAGQLFNDPTYIAAHGTLGGADSLANHGDDFGRAWHGQFYPQGDFSTDERAAETAFIREADFYKFRGRGIIQTTGRASYVHLVRHVQSYRGSDPILSALAARWSAMTDQQACSASTNEQWDQLFTVPDMLAVAFSLHSGGPNSYRIMSRQADVLNSVPAPRSAGQRGSIYLMGRRISGSHAYGAGIYRDRVLALMRALASLAGGQSGRVTPRPAPAPAPEPPAPPPIDPSRTPSQQRPGQELEHRTRRQPREPAPAPTPTAPRRGPVDTPDADTLRAQWAANPRAHGYFQNSESKYLEFAPLFAQRGVADAAAYLANNMVRVTFLGRSQMGHRDFVGPLQAAEQALAGHTIDPPVTSFGCLNVRRIAGTDRLSPHGLGRAFDLNPAPNPHIKSAADFLVIRAVTGVQVPREDNARRLIDASRQFQADFNEAWIARQTDTAVRNALANRATRERLLRYARIGFCTLDLRLIEALQAVGLNWGGTWNSSKDFMHFQLP